MPDFEPPKYLSSLIAAINDGAKAAQTGAFGVLALGVYLLAVAIATTDEDLLLGHTTNLTQLGVQVAPAVSLGIAPLVFVALHVFTLVRYDLLGANLRQFRTDLDAMLPLNGDRERTVDRERCRQLLANIEFVELLAAPAGSPLRTWLFGGLVLGMIVFFPIGVLLTLQASALRFQNSGVLSAQRAALAIDLLMLGWFFAQGRLAAGRTARVVLAALPVILVAILTLAEVTWLTLPGPTASADEVRTNPPEPWLSLHGWGQPLDRLICPRIGWGCRYLDGSHRPLIARIWKPDAMAVLRHTSPSDKERQDALAAIEGVFLQGRSLRFAKLENTELFGANLAGADLTRADLQGATLQRASLEGPNPEGPLLSRTLLSHAQLSGADLRGADLRGADLRGADLTRAHLDGADLGWADLTGAELSHAFLTHAGLGNAQLAGANLKSANLEGAGLFGARLSGANLTGANLTGAHLAETELSGANLKGVDLTRTHLGEIGLTGANLSYADLASARLSSDYLESANLIGANLASASLTGASLSYANLTGANLDHADLSGANLTRTIVTQVQLDAACGTRAFLPPGLNLESCAHETGPGRRLGHI